MRMTRLDPELVRALEAAPDIRTAEGRAARQRLIDRYGRRAVLDALTAPKPKPKPKP